MNAYECFCDKSYYDLWVVRRKDDREFGQGFHLHNKKEAEQLCEMLNSQRFLTKQPETEVSEKMKGAKKFHAASPKELYESPVVLNGLRDIYIKAFLAPPKK